MLLDLSSKMCSMLPRTLLILVDFISGAATGSCTDNAPSAGKTGQQAWQGAANRLVWKMRERDGRQWEWLKNREDSRLRWPGFTEQHGYPLAIALPSCWVA